MSDQPQKNEAAVSLGRKGGQAKSEAKTKAARENVQKRWTKYRQTKSKDSPK